MRHPLAMLCAAIAILASGCGGQDYTVDIAFSPSIPVPLKQIAVQVDVKEDGEPLKGAKVVLRGDGPSISAPSITLKEGAAGRYETTKFEFSRTGDWTLHVDVTTDGDPETHSQKLTVTCKGAGTAGDACCSKTHCDNGLTCVFAACAAGPNAPGGGCYTDSECDSGKCTKGVCAAPSCTDGLVNGDETDEDCGGTCDKCERGKICKVKGDCASGFCTAGRCTHEVGSLLGAGDGSKGSVTWKVITTKDLAKPTDLAFSTAEENKLWVTNLVSDAYTVISNAGQADQSQSFLKDSSQHFSEKNMGIAFTDAKVFGTCGDTRNGYNGKKKENDFMGPVMWPGQESLYTSGSVASVHWDMLHQTPNCMGIGGDGGHRFYCVNGLDSTLDWYDFKEPHEPGGEDHTDGHKRRYLEVKLTRVEGVPSNVSVDHANNVVYLADSGGGRVLKVDVSDAKEGASIPKWSNDGSMFAMSGAKVSTLVAKGASGLVQPSGLVFLDGVVYVADHGTGKIHCFSATDGKELRSLDSGLGKGALGGLTVSPDPELKLYFTDLAGNRVVRVDP